MTPLRKLMLEVHDAPTVLRKCRAIDAIIYALEVEVGLRTPPLVKTTTGAATRLIEDTTSLKEDMARLGAEISNLVEQDRSRAGRRR